MWTGLRSENGAKTVIWTEPFLFKKTKRFWNENVLGGLDVASDHLITTLLKVKEQKVLFTDQTQHLVYCCQKCKTIHTRNTNKYGCIQHSATNIRPCLFLHILRTHVKKHSHGGKGKKKYSGDKLLPFDLNCTAVIRANRSGTAGCSSTMRSLNHRCSTHTPTVSHLSARFWTEQ